ncbi:MAG TPA: precorrin-6y C5,15-methyltransferase (decarboxylating) subunit CbiE [Polyangiaceae bacterium]|nr:precorrin-6y C5,15-methyltransferase (decarboxylating) subunit CbiE [Polyangiaceae bacterium]
MSQRRAVTVIGMGDDGCAGLSSRAASAVSSCQVLVGGERHLAFFPQFRGERITLRAGVGPALDRVAELANEHTVSILSSGDPLFFGVGSLVCQRLGAEHVEIIPAPSSVQWAFARVGIAWENAEFVSAHGRTADGLVSRLRRSGKAAILTDATHTPATLARRFLDHGDRDWTAWVCERLAGPGERVRRFELAELAVEQDIDPLNVLLLVRPASWRPPPAISFLHEDQFAKRMPKNGLITKREVRLLSLASLGLAPDSVVWDVGAGSGSVSIEAAMLAFRGRTYAIEVDPEGANLCRENARSLGLDNVHVVEGRAPEALRDLEAPDAVFVGGSKGSMDTIIEATMGALSPGGRLVINAVTLENVGEAYTCLRARGLDPAVTLVQIARGAALARYQRYEAHNPIHIFAVEKPSAGSGHVS